MMAEPNTKGGQSSGLRFRWPAFYIGLAIVELVVVGVAGHLYHGVADEFASSVEAEAASAARVERYGDLAALGSEILSSRGLERGTLQARVGRFEKELERAREVLDGAPLTPHVEALTRGLESASGLMSQFGAGAQVVASYPLEAAGSGPSRLALDEMAAALRPVLRRLVSDARSAQRDLLAGQGGVAARAQDVGWMLAAAVLVLIGLMVLQAVHLFRQARRAAVAADAGARSKSAFLSRMGYAIRTPMNSILGMTEVVLDTPLTADQKTSLETVRASAEELHWTLTNVLDYAKSQAGRLSLDKAPMDLRACIHDVVRALARRAHTKGIELVWNVDAEVPQSVLGDSKRIRQVIGNLVDNAITYTDCGEVVVRARAKRGHDEEIALTFDISDTGIGIPEERRQKLFRAFHEDPREAGSVEGIGIGLAVSAELVGLMNGQIDVESEMGRGTTFRFTARLEVDPASPRRDAAEGGSELRECRVLVVDDNATSRQILGGMLRGARAMPGLAEGAEEAVAMLRMAKEAGRPYAVALIDLEMPQVSGLELARQIKDDPALATTELVGLGATGEADEAHQCNEVGMAGYLPKPIRAAELVEVLHGVVALRAAQSKDARDSLGYRRLRVLLADDNRVDRRLGVRLLQKRGHEVVAVENGSQAIEVSGQEAFDLILMDVQMPQVDGLEATRAIREREKETGQRVPIIALTAHDMKGRCAEVGMDDYVTKPVDAYEVTDVIARHIATREVDMDDLQMTRGGSRPMDEEAALERAGGEHSLLVELANMCLADTPDAVDSIRSALEGGDAKGLQRAAHKLKGSLLVLAADPASEAAYRLETLGAEGSLDSAAAALSALEQELDRLKPALAKLAESETVD